MSTDLYLEIPQELKQYQLISKEDTTECLINDILAGYLNSNEKHVERAEYYSANGELLKRTLFDGNSVQKEMYFINGRICTEKEFDKNNVSVQKNFDKDGNIICTTLYIYRNRLIISIIKKKHNNEYKISYSYDEAKRIINRSIYINQELVNKQIYCYNRDNRVKEYQDDNQCIKVFEETPQNELVKYVVTDILGNEISVYNHFENSEYIETEITLNGHKTILKDKNYIYNQILQKPDANEEDLDLVILNLYKQVKTPTKCKNNINIISSFIKNKEAYNNILPITIRKHALVI